MKLYGLIGFPLEHSFSAGYFSNKFVKENIPDSYFKNFPLTDISQFKQLLIDQPDLKGLAVTIPYKVSVLPFLDELSSEAKAIGAVNSIRIVAGRTMGFNTDVTGFERSFLKTIGFGNHKALILGTGGSSKAVSYVLDKHGINHLFVSRSPSGINEISYLDIDKTIIEDHTIIINCTPVGMYPQVDNCPDILFEYIDSRHFLFDLIYNPAETVFLNRGKVAGAKILNGMEMLQIQAEENWKIWNAGV